MFSCVLDNKLLPNVRVSAVDNADNSQRTSSISVLVASLHEIFYKGLRGYYRNHTIADGQQLGVYTASHEEEQYLKSVDHDKKALVDMYLLSFSDTLVTSAWSTFGYVSQGISGATSWILTKIEDEEVAFAKQQGQCIHASSIEPCFHAAPVMDCDNKGWGLNPGEMYPHIQYCEDIPWGIKIMNKPRVTFETGP